MKKGFLFALMAGMMGCFYACNLADDPEPEVVTCPVVPVPVVVNPAEPVELTLKQAEKVNADNQFTFNIFREVSAASGDNTFFSPLSLNMALGMLYNGASGATRTEMTDVLGLAEFTETEINEYYQSMSLALQGIDPLTELSIANSIWYREGFAVKKPFLDVNRQYFDAMVKALDFNRSGAADTINNWCAEKTKDRIKDIIQPQIPRDVVMYLINAIYFKSKWQSEFDKAQTKQDDFTKAGNQKVRVNLMEQTTYLPYYADEKLQCVEMPYGNGAFSMVAVLPADNMHIEQLIDYLDNTVWQDITGKLNPGNVWLKLPRFKIECELALNDPVKNVGMQRIFSGGFENLTDEDVFVSQIKQKTFVEVNEEGTEAAAATVIAIANSFSPEPPQKIQFFASRPFLYLIKEKSTGVILFIGRMDEPAE
jgi:serpin B